MPNPLKYTPILGFSGPAGRHPLFLRWRSMKKRCSQPSDRSFKYYGGKGISVCDRWLDFGNFVNDMGIPPEGYTLDRIDSSLGYYPENCRWATPAEQARNISSNIDIEIAGVTLNLTDWAEKNKIPYDVCQKRITKLGWNPIDAVTLPVKRGLSYSLRAGK